MNIFRTNELGFRISETIYGLEAESTESVSIPAAAE